MTPEWRTWPKVCKARSGAANSARYTGKTIEGQLQPGECWWCDRRATKLCDTMLRGRNDAGDLDRYRADGPTCDASVCEEHATMRFDIRGHGDGGAFYDTVDACPYCSGKHCVRSGETLWTETDYVSAGLWRERVTAHATMSKEAAPEYSS